MAEERGTRDRSMNAITEDLAAVHRHPQLFHQTRPLECVAFKGGAGCGKAGGGLCAGDKSER